MTKVSWRFWVVGLGCGLLAASAPAQNPTIAIKAVKLNPTCVGGTRGGQKCVLPPDCPGGTCGGDITPTDTLDVKPRDIIVADIVALDYSPAGEKLLAYQAVFQNSFAASERGDVNVLRAFRHCETTVDCSIVSPSAICNTDTGLCEDTVACPEGDADCTFISATARCNTAMGRCDETVPLFRAGGIDIDTSRFDYVFFGFSVITGLDIKQSDLVRLFSTLASPSDSLVYPGSPKYLATISFQVGFQMCGTAEILPTPADTRLIKKDTSFIQPLDLSPLTLNGRTGLACACLNIVDSDPTNCVIEARQPFEPDGTGAVPIKSVRLKFDCPDASSITSTENFVASELRPQGFPPFIASVVVDPADRSWVTVNFRRAFKDDKWTCTKFVTSGDEVCLGLLAADVNADSLIDEMDVEALAENATPAQTSCLRDPGSCVLRQCDADRTDLCTPADILRVVDIINGGGAFGTLSADRGILDIVGDPIACPSLPSPP